MDINSELGKAIDRARGRTGELLEQMRKGAPDQRERAWTETQSALKSASAVLGDFKTTLEIDANVTRELLSEYVHKIEKVQLDLDLALLEMSDSVLHRSAEGAEAAVTKARRVLDSIEGIFNKKSEGT